MKAMSGYRVIVWARKMAGARAGRFGVYLGLGEELGCGVRDEERELVVVKAGGPLEMIVHQLGFVAAGIMFLVVGGRMGGLGMRWKLVLFVF